MIEFQGLKKIYESGGQQVAALNGIDLKINKGEIFGVIGFSGAGKSSLIRCVNLLERPTSGKVIVAGHELTSLSVKEVREIKKNIGMVFQHFNLLNSKTVFANVAMPLTLAKLPKGEIKKRVHELLEFVGLADKADYYPDQLSGGQKQRIGIARALATQPSILLCDEATSALDPQTTDAILDLLVDINKRLGLTIVLITHEMHVIRKICHRVAVMEGGRVVETGPVIDVFKQPEQDITKRFVQQVIEPDEAKDTIEHLVANYKTGKIIVLGFVGESAEKPIITQLIRSFDITVNIIQGKISPTQNGSYGTLYVHLDGKGEEVDKAIQFLQSQEISVEVIEG